MIKWASIGSVFGRHARTGSTANLRLSQAYQAVFRGKPTEADQQLVLVDMLAKSGFQTVTPSNATDAELRQQEGKRQLYAETVFSHLSLAPWDIQALENAARFEAALTADD